MNVNPLLLGASSPLRHSLLVALLFCVLDDTTGLVPTPSSSVLNIQFLWSGSHCAFNVSWLVPGVTTVLLCVIRVPPVGAVGKDLLMGVGFICITLIVTQNA